MALLGKERKYLDPGNANEAETSSGISHLLSGEQGSAFWRSVHLHPILERAVVCDSASHTTRAVHFLHDDLMIAGP